MPKMIQYSSGALINGHIKYQNGEECDFDCSVIFFLLPTARVWVFPETIVSWFSCTTVSRVYSKWCEHQKMTDEKDHKFSSAYGNYLWMREVRKEWSDGLDRKATVTQLTTNCAEQNPRGWSATAEDHVGFHSFPPRTETRGCSGHSLAKLDNWRLENLSLGW